MAVIRSTDLAPAEAYKLLTGIIVPRPIGWLTTLSPAGLVNLAPFSAFALVTHAPPMLMVSVGRKAGQIKDTAANLLAEGEFVANVAGAADAVAVHESSADYAWDESEVQHLGFGLTPSHHVKVPRLAQVRAAMECRVRQILQWDDVDATVFLADVLGFFIEDGLLQAGKVDSFALDPLARIGGPNYTTLGERISFPPATRKELA